MIALLMTTQWGKQNTALAAMIGLVGDICIAMVLIGALGGR